ncbi:uncharacterized protein VICG_00249, partial [Vittaforma corneae ATCC 50505]
VSAAKEFLKTEDDHTIYIKPLIKALKTAKNRNIVACVFDIAALLNVREEFIRRKYLQKYFKRTTTRYSVLGYLNSFSIDFLDQSIKKRIEEDASFQSEEVYEYIKNRPVLARDLLFSSGPGLIPKQLNIIVNCKLFFNIQNYIQLLGHNTKLISFKAFEAFSIFFNEVSTNESILDTLDLRNAVRKRDGYPNEYCLNIGDNSVCISDATNFIVFGWCFLPEKAEILKVARSQDHNGRIAKLKSIANKYSTRNLPIESDIEEDHLVTYHPTTTYPFDSACSFFNHYTFDHLFAKQYKKDICDCYEI